MLEAGVFSAVKRGGGDGLIRLAGQIRNSFDVFMSTLSLGTFVSVLSVATGWAKCASTLLFGFSDFARFTCFTPVRLLMTSAKSTNSGFEKDEARDLNMALCSLKLLMIWNYFSPLGTVRILGRVHFE